MAKVTFKRYETDAEAQASNIVDGQFIVTKEGTSYIDYGEDRVSTNGTRDTAMSDTSQNAVQNKVIKEYVDDGIQEAKDYVDGTVLYQDETGSSGNITLSDSITNYSVIKIFYYNGNIENSIEFYPRIASPNIVLESSYKTGTDYIHTTARYVCSGTSLTVTTSECGYYAISSNAIQMHWDNTNYSKIYKIIGYK